MKLLKVKILLNGFALVLFLSACEEIIDIDLNSSDPVMVAEGLIEKDSVAWLKLSYTSDYFDSEESEKIETAIVTLNDGEGNSEILDHKGNGLYRGNSILGESDMEYSLTIENEDFIKNATSILYDPVEIYSVEFEESEIIRPGQEEGEYYDVTLKLSNNSALNDYILIKFWVNTVEDNSYYMVNEEFYAKGDTIEYSPFQLELKKNDELYMKVYSVDLSTYEYYYQLNELGGGGRMGGSSTPYNPQSNFGEDIMGYFTAWSFIDYSTIVN